MSVLHAIWHRIKSFFVNDEDDLSMEDKLDLLATGDIVSLKFRDPRTLGFLDPESNITSRFEQEDFITRRLKGQVTRVVTEQGYMYFELQVVKSNGTIRKYIFFEDQLEELEFLDTKHGD